MSRRKDLVKGGAPIHRIKENPRLMHTHETMVDFIKATASPMNGRHSDPFLNVLTSGLLGLDFRNFDLQDDFIYSDDGDDDIEDDDEDDFYSHSATHRPLEPHPRIRLLTDEEVAKHEKELMAEDKRRKDKTEKNKRKKLRKKEKKRLEKENAFKDMLPEEEKGKSESSDNKEENPIIDSNAEVNESLKCSMTPNPIEAVGCDESSVNNKEENLVKMNKKEDEQKDLDLNNSYASTAELVPEETCNQKNAKDRKKEKSKLPEVQLLKEETPKNVEKSEVQKKMEEKHKPFKEKTLDPTAEEYAKRSRELANAGNHLAASGEYKMAVKCFTDAIKFNPQEFRLFGNRSLCYERMQQYENALRDADLALSMEPNWIKGLFRKGKALCGLKKYYEASLIYREVLKLDSSSTEATQELKRAQTLHLMEMGFTWAQSTEALKTHTTLEEVVEALFGGDRNWAPGDASAGGNDTEQLVVQEEDDDEGEWIVLQASRPRMQQVKDSEALVQSRSKSQSPTPHSRNSMKPELFSIWVGSLAPAVTYAILHELFSRVGAVYSIKMLLEHQCAFVNYTRREDCDRAIQCFDGMVLEGAPLSVRYPSKGHTGLGMSKSAATDPLSRPGPYKKECFFWRTTGCTRGDCTYRHVPEHKNIDRDKFTSRLGHINM